jgi:uncharacterized protein (TIGR03067 family)
MRKCFIGFLAALVATSGMSAVGDDAKEQAIKKDRKKYAGIWRVTALEVDGNKASEDDARKITVVNHEDGTWIIQVDGKEINKGTSEIDPTKKPKTIDFIPDDGPEKGKTFLAIYFSAAWQVLEEDAAGSMQDQYVWSRAYIDAMVERDTPTQRLYVQQDANWNITALVDTSASVQERYIYDPFGVFTVLAPNWGARGTSAFNWVYLHQGGKYDNNTACPVLQDWQVGQKWVVGSYCVAGEK